MKIPCDTIARLSRLLPSEPSNDAMQAFRLDNGMVITTNRSFMAVEKVYDFEGVFYIRNDPALIEQCKLEAQWSSVIDFTPVAALQYTTAQTSMGWKCGDNLGLWPVGGTPLFDRWREIVSQVRTPINATQGPMVTDVTELANLAATSPSGKIAFEQFIDPINRPTVVRDIDSHDWVGFFHARITDGQSHNGASVPGWCR